MGLTRYFAELNIAVGAAWNQFWFTPATARLLGVMRIGVGLLALYSVATYLPDLERWFGADGMLPVEMVRELYSGQFSLLDYVRPNMLLPAYWASLAVLGLYVLGVGGRAIAVAATVVTLSFFGRAPQVTGQFEPILIMLMVYLCIGRCCDAFSIMSLRKMPADTAESSTSPLNTMSLRLIQVHLAIVHLMMGWAQLAVAESAWWSGEGVWLAAARPGMSLVDLSGLEDHPRIVAAWSHVITLYLLTFPALVWNRHARPLLLAVGAMVWISFAVASGWVPFCLAMLIGLVAFIPAKAATHIGPG